MHVLQRKHKSRQKVLIAYGAEVRRLRKEHGLTQTTLAKKVSSSKTAISDLERALVNPSAQLREEVGRLRDEQKRLER